MAGEIQKNIVIPRNFLEVLQEMQFDIALEADEIKAVQLAHEAVRTAVGGKENLHIAGSREVIIHSLTSLVMKRLDKGHSVTAINETIARGNIDALQVVRFDNAQATIVLDIGGATIKDPIYPEDPNRGRINGVLRVPVSSVLSIWPAA